MKVAVYDIGKVILIGRFWVTPEALAYGIQWT
jgi:hypothetical protein